MSTVTVAELAVTTEQVDDDAVHLYELALTVATSIEPYATVTQPAGTWTQTAGTTVAVTEGKFTAPPTINGTTITFSDGTVSKTYQILPHTLWIRDSNAFLQPLKV